MWVQSNKSVAFLFVFFVDCLDRLICLWLGVYSDLQVVLFIPLLALLPNSTQDIALCHNTLMVLLDLLHKVSSREQLSITASLLHSSFPVCISV